MSQKFFLTNDTNRSQVAINCLRFIQSLDEGKQWKVEITQYRRSRSNDQNAALFGVAYPPLIEYTGYTKDEIHEWMCCDFFGTREYEINGVPHSRPMRTTTRDETGKINVLDWLTFSQFYANVQRVGSEAGVHVPDPDPMLSKRWREPREAA